MEIDKNRLLIISSGFPDKSGNYLAHTFVKGYVDEAMHLYQDVTVLVLRPFLPKLLRSFTGKSSAEISNYSYENVQVVYKSYPYIPLWPFANYKGKIAYFFISSSIFKYISNKTIMHANFTSPSGVFASLLSKKLNKEYILTVHEDHDWLIKEIDKKNKLLINAWKGAKILIRVNNLDNDILKQYNKNVVTIPNGFNHRKFKVLDKEKCKENLKNFNDKKIIVNIGFYKEQKNQKLLIDAVNLLPNNIKRNLKCYIIGGGPKHDELKDYVDTCGLNNIVEIVGQVKHEELPIYLNVADIFCLSSNSEGNPTVMFEALGVGIPYVGTNVGGVPEIITSDAYGFLCPPNDKQKLKKIIEKGLNKDWDKTKIIKYARSFSWKNIFLKTKQYY